MDSRAIARLLGQRGGRARARRLSPHERERIASLGGKARALSLLATRRLIANLQYAAVLRDLRQPPEVTRQRALERPLPDVRRGR